MSARNTHRAAVARTARDRLGIDRIGRGFDLVAYILILYQLSVFIIQSFHDPVSAFSTAAWVLLLVTAGLAQIGRWRFGEDLPSWMFASALVVWAVVVGLDLVGSGHRSVVLPTAAVAVGAGLLLFITLRPGRLVAGAGVALGVVLAVGYAVRGEPDLLALGPAIVTLTMAAVPPVLGVGLVNAIRTVAAFERGLAQAQSTVNAPRFTVGLMASEELARLDLDAERLLDSIGGGRVALPLDSRTASDAATLATELRLHLIEGRRETWLYHAVSESTFLGPHVTVTDPEGLAGLLGAPQRDGLLTAVWLLVSDPVRKGQASAQTLQLTLRRGSGRSGPENSHPQPMRISIETTGVPRTGVDPAAWQAIRKVGRFSESSAGSAMRIEIECVIDRSID